MKFLPLGVLVSLLFSPAMADSFGLGGGTFEMDFVTIGDAGNAADFTGYGSVGYTYRMGVNEVSRGMIDTYNALKPTHGGPTLTMGDLTEFGGNGVNRPATGISWNEAARFVNWLNTSKGFTAAYKFGTDGYNDNIVLWSTTDSGYDAANRFRNSNAHYFLPNENEWYKAAYYDPNKRGGAGYWDYATASDFAPVPVASGTMSGTAVYNTQIGPADITNAGGLSPYGTMAQNGNVWEWNESAQTLPNDSAGESRLYDSGDWDSISSYLASASYPSGSAVPTNESFPVGFRVAAIPEPSGVLMTMIAMVAMVLRRRR